MADIKLGLAGSEVTLPVPCAPGGRVRMPVGRKKQADRATMSDGTTRFNSKSYHPKTFSHDWGRLSAAELAPLQTLDDLNVKLHYQNTWIDTTWRWVFIASFDFEPIIYLGTVLFRASMTLEEVL